MKSRATHSRFDGLRNARPSRFVLGAILVAVLVLVLRALYYDFLSDDAFITFRYARNLARGEGLVYNAGDRVEGYTSFLDVALLAGASAFRAPLVQAGRLFSLLGAVVATILTFPLATRSLDHRTDLALLATVLVAAQPDFAVWALGGLEGPIFCALVVAAVLVAAPPATVRRSLFGGGVGVLLALTRPEGAAVWMIVAALSFLSDSGQWTVRVRRHVPGWAAFVGIYGGFLGWRLAYYGALVPNTYVAKGGFTAAHVQRGWDYLLNFLDSPFALATCVLACVGIVDLLWRRRPILPCVLVAMAAIVVGEGGDGLPMYRFFVPLVPLLAVAAVCGVRLMFSWLPKLMPIWLARAAVTLVILMSFFPEHDEQYNLFRYQRDVEIPRWQAAGEALAAFPRPTVIATVPIGAIGFYSDQPVIDMTGLTDRTIAATPVDRLGSGWAGHEKHNGAYVLSRRPDVVLLGNVLVDRNAEAPIGAMVTTGSAAVRSRERDLVTDPRFAKSYELATLPLNNGWFLHYFRRGV